MTAEKSTVESLLHRFQQAFRQEGIDAEVVCRPGQALLAARPHGEDSPLRVLVQISERVDVPLGAGPAERDAGPPDADIACRPTLDLRGAVGAARQVPNEITAQ